jgi:N-acetylglucosaminyldiphosphoundecaprenol N-acetyl-beta-D-mannosaminyltransferase
MTIGTRDDLSRDVYCVLGMPIDAGDMPSVLSAIDAAAGVGAPFFISTPNLNYLVNMQSDVDFRHSVLQSDLCTADGMPIVLIARLFGIPIKSRVAGSDIFDALRDRRGRDNPLKVFMFGGAEGVAAAACQKLNAKPGGLYCVGWHDPGFGSVEGMSADDVIDKINSSAADFLMVSLGAKNGQSWLLRNHERLQVPVRAHLGAVINFQAGTIKRAPSVVGKIGLEWLWRIKEEPHLWRRYWIDGRALLFLLATRVLPLMLWGQLQKMRSHLRGHGLAISLIDGAKSVTVVLSGAATSRHLDKIIPTFKEAIATKKDVVIDFSETYAIDARFLGLLLMVIKTLKPYRGSPRFIGLSGALDKVFRLNGLGLFL